MRFNGFPKFLAPVLLTALSLLSLAVAADRRLDDLTQEIEVRDGYTSAGQRSMKLLGKFKRPKSQSYAPPKSHQKPKYHPPPQYGSPIQYAPPHPGPPHPQYAPPHYGPPPKPEYGPPKHQYGPPKHQPGPPKHQYGPPKPEYGPPKPEYGPPIKPQYGPPKPQYGPPKGNYRAPTPAYGPPQPAYHSSSAYVKPQQQPPAYASAPPANAIYSPPQQGYAQQQPSPGYSQPPAHNPAPPPPPPSIAYAPLAPPAYSSPSITYSAIDPPQTDYNQPPLTVSYNSSPSNDDDDDDSHESTSSDHSSASNYNVPAPDNYEPAEPKPSDDVKEVSDDQVEEAPVVAVFVATESSVPPKQTEFVPSYPHYTDDTDNSHPETDDSPKQSGYASSIPIDSVQETDNNQQAEDPQKGTEPEIIISPVSEAAAIDGIPTISPPVSADEALAYSPNFGDNSAFPDSTDHDFSSFFNFPSNFYKQTGNGAEADKDNDFGFFQLGIFPKTSSFFEQNYNG